MKRRTCHITFLIDLGKGEGKKKKLNVSRECGELMTAKKPEGALCTMQDLHQLNVLLRLYRPRQITLHTILGRFFPLTLLLFHRLLLLLLFSVRIFLLSLMLLI